MKENDFDEIGKRLYNQEAEPPQDGFSKIRAALVTPATPTKTILIKNWWKPLVLLIPVVVYLTVNDTELNQTMASTSLTNAVKAESSNQKETEGATLTKSSTAEEKQTINAPEQQEPIRLPKKQYASTTEQAEIIPIENEIVEEKETVSIETSEQSIPTEVKYETEGIKTPLIIALNPVADSIQQDSLIKEELTTVDPLEKEVKTEETPEEKSKLSAPSWRLNASFAPQHITKNIKPVADDEVFLTSARKNSDTENIGFTAAIGIGRSVTRNLYIDANLSYTQIKQSINLSYTTGKVDTMLAVQQADQTVVLKPVYAYTNREIANTFGYAGLRLTGTYYFWTGERSRFNFSASAGAHYLVSAQAKERINGEWVELNSDNIEKLNYNLSVGAGYSMLFNKGWELQINPTLSYFIKNVKNEELPYSYNQQSVGLQLMLLKKLGTP
ncbi:MAG: hypothetical protein QY309_02370 [Cyclobacteriaceae bacterium]|nr:MAG: hypothetical protein QY309_02370 [Cyclobacteriaceae bacterium]